MLKHLPLLLLLTLSIRPMAAQTYTSSTPYNCNPTTHAVITSFSEFECHVVPAGSASYQFFGPSRFEMFAPFAIPPQNATLQLTNFTQPSGSNPGTYSFTWSGTDQNGIQHSGTASGTWVSGGPNWRGWRWAELTSNSITIEK